tara:strand:- start:27406 stop:27663 length:258 start_codon:yes stop_codon:yes gene_type:complete
MSNLIFQTLEQEKKRLEKIIAVMQKYNVTDDNFPHFRAVQIAKMKHDEQEDNPSSLLPCGLCLSDLNWLVECSGVSTTIAPRHHL